MKKTIEKLEYQCCFCAKGLENKILTFIATTEWDNFNSESPSQQFWSHISCFKKTLADNVPLCFTNLIEK